MNLYHHTVIPPVITKLLFRHLIVGLTQMRLALTDISSDPAELCALPGMRGPRQLATFAVAKYFRPGCPFLYGGSPWQA